MKRENYGVIAFGLSSVLFALPAFEATSIQRRKVNKGSLRACTKWSLKVLGRTGRLGSNKIAWQ
jgi:hypothetical protein